MSFRSAAAAAVVFAFAAMAPAAPAQPRLMPGREFEARVRTLAARSIRPNNIELDRIRVEGPVSLIGLKIEGRLALTNSHFDVIDLSNLEATDVDFHGTTVDQVIAEQLRTTGSVDFAHGFKARHLHLVDASIGGFLSFDGAALTDPNGTVITGDGLKVGSSITFRAGFVSQGEVRLPRVQIGRNLDAHGGKFLGGGTVLDASGATIGSDVFLYRDDAPQFQQNFVADGAVGLANAAIGGNLLLNNAEFRRGSSVDARGTTIRGSLIWTACDRAPVDNATLNLDGASVGTVEDREGCWPRLSLDGFRYRRFAMGSPQDATARLRWIEQQQSVATDPYRNLATVLGNLGDPDGAREVLMRMEYMRRSQDASLAARVWNWTLRLTVGYGYAVWRAGYWSLFLLAVGTLIFHRAYRNGGIHPTDDDAAEAFINDREPATYRPFSAPMYAIDSFLPIINFGQKERWEPNAKAGLLCGPRHWRRPAGWWARAYLWFHIAFGWILTTLFVAGMTGIVKSG